MKTEDIQATAWFERIPGVPRNEDVDAQILAGLRAPADVVARVSSAPSGTEQTVASEESSQPSQPSQPSQQPTFDTTTRSRPRFIAISPGLVDALTGDDDEDENEDADVSDADMASAAQAIGVSLLNPLGRHRAREHALKGRVRESRR